MSTIRLDLSIYPLPVVLRAIDDYGQLADISLVTGNGGESASDKSVELSLHTGGPHPEGLIADEFLNYLIALLVKMPAQEGGVVESSLEP